MKRYCAFLLLTLFLLAGCGAPHATESISETNSPPPHADSAFTPSTVERITAIDSEGTQAEIWVGMSLENFTTLFPNALTDGRNYFLQATNQQVLFIRYQYQVTPITIDTIEVYNCISSTASDSDFSSIRVGMSMSEVISIVGIPHEIPQATSLHYYHYVSNSGKKYTISWEQPISGDRSTSDFVVAAINIQSSYLSPRPPHRVAVGQWGFERPTLSIRLVLPYPRRIGRGNCSSSVCAPRKQNTA